MTLDPRTIIALVVVVWIVLVCLLLLFFRGADTRDE